MNGQSPRVLLLLLLLLPLGGCVSLTSARRHRHPAGHVNGGEDASVMGEDDLGGTQAVALDTTRRARAGEEPDGPSAKQPVDDADDSPTGGEAPLSADPHSERPGTREEQAPFKARTVAFVAPSIDLRAVRVERRPALPESASLALATVRGGEVVFDGEAVLVLGKLLTKESAVKNVVGLDPPDLARANLTDLAKAARARGRDLLLVDVRSPDSPGDSEGFLLETHTRTLLARWTLSAKSGGSTPASSGVDPDLCERLARTYARLTK